LPGSGFPNDLGAFQAWANDIARNGPVGFYSRASFIDYPPVYLLLLGAVSLLTGGNIGEGVKLVPMFADLGLAAVVWLMALEMGVTRRRAFIAALIVLVNPITWFNSAIWGQADAVGSIFLLLGLRELQKDRRESASVLAVLAVLTKLQLGVLGFVVGFVVLRRSLAPRTGEPEPGRILSCLGAGLATAALVCLPFTGLDLVGAAGRIATGPGLLTIAVGLVAGLGVFFLGRRYLPIVDLARRTQASVVLGLGTVVVFAGMVYDSIASHLISTFGEYPYLTLNAYNPWALVADGANAMDRTLAWIHDAPWADAASGTSGPGYLIGPFPPVILGLAFVVVVLLLVAAFAGRRVNRGLEEIHDQTAAETSTDHLAPSGASPRWRAEFGGLSCAFLIAAAAIAIVVLVSLTGRLYAALLGDGLLVAILIGVSIWAAWRDDAQSLLVALTVLTIAFFVVPTRAHERYLFPFFGLGAVLLTVSPRWRRAYVVLSVVNAANLLAVLVQYGGIPAADGTLAGTLNDWGNGLVSATWFDGIIWPIAVCGAITGLAMVWALLQLRGRAVAALDREVAAAALEPEPEPPGWWPQFRPADSYGAPLLAAASSSVRPEPATGAAGAAAAPVVDAAIGAPDLERPEYAPDGSSAVDLNAEYQDWEGDGGELDEPDRPQYVPGRVMSLWRRLARPSAQPDRSASLDSEPRGRIDKLDIWVVVALVVAVLSMRVYRLDEPQQMYFDEVYHARSATEFLQDWRYNIPHDVNGVYIYEWTHPMLAKYAIAAGITLFSDDKVTATADINVTVKATLVQPRTATSPGGDPNNPDAADSNARYGDRLFVATGSDVLVYDLQSRALVQTYSIPGAESFSAVGPTGLVYVGSSSGQIYRIDTNNLDDLQNGLTTTVKPPVELGVSAGLSITHLYSGTPPYLLAADSSGNIVSIDLSGNGGTISARGVVPGAADFADLGLGPAVLIRNPESTSSAAQSSTPTNSSTPTTPSSEAQALASALGMDAASVQAALDAPTTPGAPQALDLGPLSSGQVTAVQDLVAAGQLPDVQLATSDPQVIVAYQGGIGLLDVSHLILTPTIPTDSPATSIAINTNSDGSVNYSQDSYVAAGDSIVLLSLDTTGSSETVTQDGSPVKAPGVITQIVFDSATRVAQALGRTPDGTGWTVYAIETNGDAVFSDAPLPFQPVAIGLDSTPQLPDTDREEVLALAPNGSVASIDVGQFAFSWRIVGVIFGALMAACLYLLARILFRRRSIGLLVGLFSVIDGMFFAQSRIAMNDTYVGGFLLLAYLIFAVIWLNVGKSRIVFWLGMPILGVILGLALASKWVALYAIASIGILILIRSALGRLITILGLAAGTGILGSMAINEMVTQPGTGNPTAVVLLIGLALAVVVGGFVWAMSRRTTPDRVVVAGVTALVAAGLFGAALLMSPETVENGAPNYTFFLIMLAITVIAAAVNAYHPIAWTREELRFGIGAPIVVGVLAGLVGLFIVLAPITFTAFLRDTYPALGTGLVKVGVAGVAVGAVAAASFWYAGRLGFGPLALPPGPDDPSRFADPPTPAPTGWLRLGTGFGLPAVWMSACLLILPIVIYVALYIPWAMPWQPQTEATGPLPAIACWHIDTSTDLCDSAWPAGHTGQTLWDLTIQMYNYHNDLRATHPASSPWWAWPMDLKPVWFESIGYAGDTGSMIYDGGNPALWWMAIFAMAFICWQAFKRRSLGLALIAVAFFWQWVSWSRIDRAAFQYHFYTALPFFLLGLAYFLAELWHGPSRRTWLLARFAAAAALLFPAAMWLLKDPLCELARVDASNNSFKDIICGSGTGDVRIETRILLIAIVLLAALAALALLLWRLERRQDAGQEDRLWILQLLVPVGVAGVLLWWLGQNGPRNIIFEASLPTDGIVLVLLPVLAVLAFVALTARNPRRFVLGVCAFATAAFVALYPNLSALPMPNAIISIYNGLLPTWFYGFEFSTNLQASTHVSLFGTWSLALAMFTVLVAGAVAWAAWERRVVVGFRRWQQLSIGTEAAVAPAAPGEPAGSEPAGSEPAGSEPAGSEPAGSEPAGSEPAGRPLRP